MSQFTYKFTTESEVFSFDFNPVLNINENITSASCTAITEQGLDPNPSAILVGTPVFYLGKASQRVTGGLENNTYRLIMTVTTDQSNVYTCVGDIPVYSPGAI